MSNTRKVHVQWTGTDMRFEGSGVEPPSPAVPIDADSEVAPSPMQLLLMAAAGCSGADVIHILGKMRISLDTLTVDVEGVRREEHPRRYMSIHMRFAMQGEGLTREQAEGFYAVHRERPFFPALTAFMTSGPVIVLALLLYAVAAWDEAASRSQ